MKFESIEFKNIFSYGEQIQKINYSSEGKLILLKGVSGAGKSAILSLPILVLYGRLTKVTKSGIANRINKHGWIRGTIIKGQHRFVIEREFTPNNLRIWKDGDEVDLFGSSAGEDYISTEIIEIPLSTFTNMIAISMKKFKSFLSMSPTERKGVVDEVFDVRIINIIFDQIKKDARDLGQSINGDQSLLFSLTRTLTNANAELVKIQEKNTNSDSSMSKVEENKKKIDALNNRLNQYNDVAKTVIEKQNENNTQVSNKSREITENDMNIRNIVSKIDLYNKNRCPTCSSLFSGPDFDKLKIKLNELYEDRKKKRELLIAELESLREKSNKIAEAAQKVQSGMYQIRLEINNISNENLMIEEKLKASAEYQAVKNIIENTNKQLDEVRNSIDEKTKRLSYLQKLQIVYSIKGVTKMVIDNYLPRLNDEISQNLLLLGFPYTLTFDSEFNSTLKDCGVVMSETSLSDGETTRVDLVVLCSMYNLLKMKFPTINILSVDEIISSLDQENSSKVMSFMKAFAEENNINIIIVSHTSLDLDYFDDVIEVEKTNGFSKIIKGESAKSLSVSEL